MTDREGRREFGAFTEILFPVLFDIVIYLKGYAGGLVVFDVGSLHIGLVGFRPDDPGVSFTV